MPTSAHLATPPTIWTGHSTRLLEEFLGLLAGSGIESIVDVRSFPGSRKYINGRSRCFDRRAGPDVADNPIDVASRVSGIFLCRAEDHISATLLTAPNGALEVGQRGWLLNGQTLQQVRAPALQAAERAIALDPQLVEAHETLAEVRYVLDWDWAAADAEVERARALDPGSTRALSEAGALAQLRGHLSAALQLSLQSAANDPLNSAAFSILATIYYALGQFKDAAAAARKGLELTPTAPASHTLLAQMLLAQGQQDAAFAEIEKESDQGFRAYALARTYILLGRKGDADAALAQAKKTFAASQPYNIATIHALRGELDQAFLWLNRAYEQHDPDLVGWPPFTVDPDLKSLREDPRYKAFLRKMNLPE
jgi:tetratricopeptide (TPR) repeat protein